MYVHYMKLHGNPVLSSCHRYSELSFDQSTTSLPWPGGAHMTRLPGDKLPQDSSYIVTTKDGANAELINLIAIA